MPTQRYQSLTHFRPRALAPSGKSGDAGEQEGESGGGGEGSRKGIQQAPRGNIRGERKNRTCARAPGTYKSPAIHPQTRALLAQQKINFNDPIDSVPGCLGTFLCNGIGVRLPRP